MFDVTNKDQWQRSVICRFTGWDRQGGYIRDREQGCEGTIESVGGWWAVSNPSEKGHEQGLFEAQQSCVELDPVSFQHVCFADNMHGPKHKKNECVALAPSGDCEAVRLDVSVQLAHSIVCTRLAEWVGERPLLQSDSRKTAAMSWNEWLWASMRSINGEQLQPWMCDNYFTIQPRTTQTT